MAYLDKKTVAGFRDRASAWLAVKHPAHTIETIKSGRDAWTVAHGAGIVDECYRVHKAHDAHIQTALEAIFPYAVFRDKKHY